MDQQSKRQPDSRDRKIAELEAKLQRAYQVIGNLQQTNIELQKRIAEFNSAGNQKSVSPTSLIAVSPPQKVHVQNKRTIAKRRTTPPPSKYTANMNKPRFRKLPHLQFYGLIALVVLTIVSLFGFSSFLAQRAKNKNSETVNNLPIQQQPNFPTQPPIINTQNPVINQPNLSNQPSNLPLESSSQLSKTNLDL
ncbi:hypothetical protein CEN40_07025, partial [Fischerella thermalis CCMEE 5205]